MARKIFRLKSARIARMRTPGRYADGGNLWLQISRWKTKSWLFQYVAPNGKVRQMGLGALHTIGLAEARERAAEARKSVLDGKDPITIRQAQKFAARAERAKAVTFEQYAEDYIESRKATWKAGVHASQWRASLKQHAYPVIGKLHPKDIDTRLVLKILKPVWQSKTETATRVRARIAAILDAAKVDELRSGDNPARWKGHLKEKLPDPTKLKKVKHHPALPWEEIGTFMSELRQRNFTSARALEFTVLTAARTSEVIDATWPEINFEEKVWTIPATRMKAKRPHRVPLSNRAIEILRSLHREEGNDFLFVGGKKGAQLSDMAMLQLCRGMRPGTTTHGFRSSFRDWSGEATAHPRHIIEQALAHR